MSSNKRFFHFISADCSCRTEHARPHTIPKRNRNVSLSRFFLHNQMITIRPFIEIKISLAFFVRDRRGDLFAYARRVWFTWHCDSSVRAKVQGHISSENDLGSEIPPPNKQWIKNVIYYLDKIRRRVRLTAFRARIFSVWNLCDEGINKIASQDNPISISTLLPGTCLRVRRAVYKWRK